MEYFGTNLTESGHYRFNMDGLIMERTWQKFNDLPFHPENLTNGLPFGEVIFYQGGGYTVIAISGSCADSRQGTKSVFWVKEIVSKSELIMKIMQNKAALRIINAIPFTINWNVSA